MKTFTVAALAELWHTTELAIIRECGPTKTPLTYPNGVATISAKHIIPLKHAVLGPQSDLTELSRTQLRKKCLNHFGGTTVWRQRNADLGINVTDRYADSNPQTGPRIQVV